MRKDSPEPRSIEPPDRGRVIAFSQVGGLHHRYQRLAPDGLNLHLSLVARRTAPHGCRSAYCRTLDPHCARRSSTIQPARLGSTPLVGFLFCCSVFRPRLDSSQGVLPFAPTIRGNSLNEDYVSVPVFPGAGDSIRIEVDKLRGNRVDASHG